MRPELIIDEPSGVSGYDYDKLRTYCDELGPGVRERFVKWFRGQTGALIAGVYLVYAYDWERFLMNLPPLD